MAGGKAAVIGFIMDYMLKNTIERKLPMKVEDVVKQELNSKNFELIDLEELEDFTKYSRFDGVWFRGDEESVLVGLGSYG